MTSRVGNVSGDRFRSTNEETIHEWAMFRLVRRDVTAPDGETFQRTFVSTPGAVGVVAVDDDGQMILVSQYRASVNGMVVEIPAGMRDVEGEEPALTAVRELSEETGYVASRTVRLGECLSSPGVTDSRVELFLATGLSRNAPEPHGPEETHMEVLHVPFARAIEMITDGTIHDAKTVCGVLLAARIHPDLIGG